MGTELTAFRRADKIIPASPMDMDELGRVPEGKQFACKLWVPRSLPHQRWYRAMLGLVSANSEDPRWSDPNKLHVWLKIRCHFVDEVGVVDGRYYCSVRSTAFTDTDQVEFKRYVDAAILVILAEVWPGLRRSDFLAEVDRASGVPIKHVAEEDPWHPEMIRREAG